MDSQNKHPYELAKEVVLSNDLLSPCVNWGVSKAELAETKKENWSDAL